MTVETFVGTDVEQARSISPVEDADDASLDSNLAAAQFEAIIRAWKGEAAGLEEAVPASPVGDADWDGSQTGVSLGIGNVVNEWCTEYTLFNSAMLCTWDCPPELTWDPGCSAGCTWTSDPNNCQVV